MSGRYSGSGGSSRRPAPSYQTSSSSRNYSSASDRDYSRSHLSGNGSSSSTGYHSSSFSASSRKPESGSTGYSYLEPNWIEKTRSSLPIDHYSSSYPLSTSRDYTTAAAAAAQPVYPSAAAAAVSLGAYNANSNMPKAYARPDDYYRAPTATSALQAPSAYGYSSAFEQSTMAAQAAAIYEMQNAHSKRESWPAASHPVDYTRRDEDRRGGGMDRRREESSRRDDRRPPAPTESWRDRERDTARDRDRRPSLTSRDRERDRDLRVTVSSSSSGARRSAVDDHRGSDTRRSLTTSATRGAGGRHEHARDRDVRSSSARRPAVVDKRAVAADSRLDRESRELERQLAKVQRELEQLESGGRAAAKKGSSRERESDRSRRTAPSSSSVPARRAPSPRARGKPPPRRVPPARVGGLPSLTSSAYRAPLAVRPRLGGRNGRPSGAGLPSLMDAVVPRPGGGRRVPLATRRAWEAVPTRRGAAPLPPRATTTRRGVIYATKRGGGVAAAARVGGGRGEAALSSREKVRRAKEKLRREEERRRWVDKKKEERDSKESREKRKEEDFAWLETIMSEDEELDEEANRKLLLAPRARRLIAIVDRAAVHPHTLESLDAKMEGEVIAIEEEAPLPLWSAEECDAIELLPIVDSSCSLASEVAAAFLDAHPEVVVAVVHQKPVVNGDAAAAPAALPDSNGNGKMEE